jgi:hypothetical protein
VLHRFPLQANRFKTKPSEGGKQTMTQLFIQAAQPYILALLQAVLVALGGIIVTAIVKEKSKFINWLNAHTTAKQRDTLHRLGEEAFAYAKTVYVSSDGPNKLAAAVAYFSSRLKEQGINVTGDEIRATIEKAYLDFKTKTTQPVAGDHQVQIVEKPVPAVIPDEVQKLITAATAFAAPAVITTVDAKTMPVSSETATL